MTRIYYVIIHLLRKEDYDIFQRICIFFSATKSLSDFRSMLS